jgi:hypothetical protein
MFALVTGRPFGRPYDNSTHAPRAVGLPPCLCASARKKEKGRPFGRPYDDRTHAQSACGDALCAQETNPPHPCPQSALRQSVAQSRR